MAGEPEPRNAAIAWEGDSLEVISSFPNHVKQNLGYQLRLLQKGERPLDYRPVASIGSGVFELREEDKRGWYRGDLPITNSTMLFTFYIALRRKVESFRGTMRK